MIACSCVLLVEIRDVRSEERIGHGAILTLCKRKN